MKRQDCKWWNNKKCHNPNLPSQCVAVKCPEMSYTKGKLVVDGNCYLLNEQGKTVATTAHIAGLPAKEAFANAQELVCRWNSQPELLEVLLRVNKWLVQNTAAANRPATLDKAILDVIAKAES